MRNKFIETLCKKATDNEKIVLVVGDLGYNAIEPFQEQFPDRFFNAGVAEQNMTGLAGGLASEGMHVFTYSIANFPVFRCAEQVRNTIDYHDLPVTIVTIGGGLAYGNLGYSHHAVQDYAFIRSLPNFKILAPGDPTEVSLVMDHICSNPGPSYLRLGKTGEPNFKNDIDKLNEKNLLLKKDNQSEEAIVVTGTALSFIYELNQKASKKRDIYSVPVWGQKYVNHEFDFLKRYKKIIVAEDHLKSGGFYSWINENFNLHNMFSFAIKNKVCGTVGSQRYLMEMGGFNLEELEKI